MPPPADAAAARRRWSGIRTQLLALLLPAIGLMLAADSWSDHEDRTRILDSAYDETLLEPISVLDDNVQINANGEIDLTVPFAVQTMFASVPALHKHLHVGLTRLDPVTGAAREERTLMGVQDLPEAPVDAKPAVPPATFGAERGSEIVFYTATYRGYPVRIATLQRKVEDASGRLYRLRVQAAESTGRRLDARENSVRRELKQDVSALAMTALLVWVGIGWALRPLTRLRESLQERAPHELQPLDASHVPHEVAPLVDAVNQHIADHRKLLAEQGRFLADASHQLRTPLAIMMTQAGYAMREQEPERLRETLRAIAVQLERSQRLTDQLLAMAHASRAIEHPLPPAAADLNAVAREVVLQYLPLAHAKNQDLGWDDVRGEDAQDSNGAGGEPAAPVRGDSAELHEALANLVHNAIKHTPPHGSIAVGVRIEDGFAVAEVCDNGPGIAAEDREVLFERFSRRAPDSGGAGLGLAIARAYARRNGGDIVLRDAPHAGTNARGLCARLVLPLCVTN